MNRRDLLRRAALIVGGAAIVRPIALVADARPRFFSSTQYALLEETADLIIPRTDTPGARDAGVPVALDALMAAWASRERQQQFRELLDQIDRSARGHADSLLAFDKARATDPIYRKFKELVLTLYYLSETGATQELRYEHTPGSGRRH
jgi:gluconate 2-dehydrogenase gamma chain